MAAMESVAGNAGIGAGSIYAGRVSGGSGGYSTSGGPSRYLQVPNSFKHHKGTTGNASRDCSVRLQNNNNNNTKRSNLLFAPTAPSIAGNDRKVSQNNEQQSTGNGSTPKNTRFVTNNDETPPTFEVNNNRENSLKKEQRNGISQNSLKNSPKTSSVTSGSEKKTFPESDFISLEPAGRGEGETAEQLLEHLLANNTSGGGRSVKVVDKCQQKWRPAGRGVMVSSLGANGGGSGGESSGGEDENGNNCASN